MTGRRSLAVAFVFVATVAALPAAAQRSVVVVREPGTRAPSFVTRLPDVSRRGSAIDVALAGLSRERSLFGIASPRRDLDPLEVMKEPGSVTVRFGQQLDGIPVWGAQYLVHMRSGRNGLTPISVNGHVFTNLRDPRPPAIGNLIARRFALARFPTILRPRITSRGLTVLPIGSGVLAYHFTVDGTRWRHPVMQEVFVNASSGGIAFTYDNLQSDGPVSGTGTTAHGQRVPLELFQRLSSFRMRDRVEPMFASDRGEITTHDVTGLRSYMATDANIVTSSSRNLGERHSKTGAVDAHFGAQKVYEYFLGLGRNSIDDSGGNIVSSVNATENNAPLFNAFWDGKQMVYGNPAPRQLFPLSADVDVVGHELTHGVTQHSGNLAYVNQSGAMNEAYSDYFGEAIDISVSGTPMTAPRAGQIGEDLCKVPNPTRWQCPLRDLNDGMTTDDFVFYLTDFDSGGVHLNSTIFSGALWDIREDLGGDKADTYVYKALVSYTTPLDDFVDGRNSVLAAATELGATPAELDPIEAAFDSRGIVEGWDNLGPNDAEILMEDVAPIATSFSAPRVSGDRFVIGDYERKEDSCCEPLQLFVGRVDGTGDLVKVGEDDNPATFNDEAPDISGSRVVWAHTTQKRSAGLDSDIHTRTLGGPVRAVTNARGLQLAPAVDGNLVAWQDNRGRQPHIWAKRIGGRERRVSPRRGTQIMAQASSGTVAWWDLGGASSVPKIGLKNLRTGRSFTIRPPNARTLMGPPALEGGSVYWYQDRGLDGVGSIMRANLSGRGRSVVVSENNANAPVWFGLTSPPIVAANGSHVAYSDEFGFAFGQTDPSFPNEQVGRDVWVVALSGGSPSLVTSNFGDQAYPQLTRTGRVLWLDSSRARTDLMTKAVP